MMPCQTPPASNGEAGSAVAPANGVNADEDEVEEHHEMYGYAPIGAASSNTDDSSEEASDNESEHLPEEIPAPEAASAIEQTEAEAEETPGLDRLIQRQLAADELLPCGGGGVGDSMSVFARPPPADPASSLAAVWRGPPPQPADGITEAEAARIREAMRGVRLPASAAPEWARRLPESEWKDLLVARLSAASSAADADSTAGSNAAPAGSAQQPDNAVKDSH